MFVGGRCSVSHVKSEHPPSLNHGDLRLQHHMYQCIQVLIIHVTIVCFKLTSVIVIVSTSKNAVGKPTDATYSPNFPLT